MTQYVVNTVIHTFRCTKPLFRYPAPWHKLSRWDTSHTVSQPLSQSLSQTLSTVHLFHVHQAHWIIHAVEDPSFQAHLLRLSRILAPQLSPRPREHRYRRETNTGRNDKHNYTSTHPGPQKHELTSYNHNNMSRDTKRYDAYVQPGDRL